MARRSSWLRLESLETREVPAAIAALDPSFGTGGKVSVVGAPFAAVALQTDGKVVAVGTSNTDFFVARYNPDGSLDVTFDGDGIRTIDFGGTDTANAVAIQANGSIVVVGSTSVGTSIAVARLTSTGALDGGFDSDGKLTIDLGTTGESGNAVAIQPTDNKIVIAGSTGADFAVVRLNSADGSLDGTFGTGGKKTLDLGGSADSANGVAIQADGNIVVAGTTGSDFAVARLLSANGGTDNSFGTAGKFTLNLGGVDVAHGLAIQPDGNILVVGNNGPDMAIIRLLSTTGGLDNSFDTDGKQTVDISGADDARAIQLQADGKILLIGDTGNAVSDLAIVRLTKAGALDTTFHGNGKLSFDVTGTSNLDLGSAAALTPQGRLVVAGKGGGGYVNGFIVRVPIELEDARQLAVGGSLDGKAKLYVPNATGQYNATALATLAVFGTTTVNARTAIGDVNGDGFEDVVLVTGPGTAIRVAVVSGKDNATLLVAPFDPFGGTFTGGGFVSTADFDNDGRSDVVVTPDQGGGPRVSIFSLGTNGSFNLRANFFGIDDPAFRGGARSAAGDINADGIADLAVAAGIQGGPRVSLYTGTTLFSTRTKLIGDFFAFEQTLRNGVFLTISDSNGDGFGDLYFGAGPGGAPRVLGISGMVALASGPTAAIASPIANFFLAGNTSNRGGVRLATTDADGDSKADLVAGTGEAQASFSRVYFGKNLGGAGEPTGFQDLDPFAGAVLAKGIFVG